MKFEDLFKHYMGGDNPEDNIYDPDVDPDDDLDEEDDDESNGNKSNGDSEDSYDDYQDYDENGNKIGESRPTMFGGYNEYDAKGRVEPAVIMNHFESKEEHEKVSSIMQQDFGVEIMSDEKSGAITDLVKRIKRKSIQKKIDSAGSDFNLIKELMVEKKSIEKIKINVQ